MGARGSIFIACFLFMRGDRGHPLADPVKWQTHAPAPQERTLLSLRIPPSRLHSPSSDLPRTWFSKHWLRRSAPVTHQDQGFELGGCPPHSPPLAAFAAPENRLFPSPSTHCGTRRPRTGLVAACSWRPRAARSNPIWLRLRALRTPSTLGRDRRGQAFRSHGCANPNSALPAPSLHSSILLNRRPAPRRTACPSSSHESRPAPTCAPRP